MPPYTIDITVEEEIAVDAASVEETLIFTLNHLDVGPCEVSVSFVGDATIQQLNRQYRNLDEPTDVLSFPQEEGEGFFGPVRILGDIVISLDTMERNALLFDVEPSIELQRLLIHGVLHLLGRDHATNEEREEMLLLQEKILGHL
ncbi:MAG TPA: rRNA maturation RNase YbeY [Sphaerochaeta sp.]|jgi:probable rRNA maturation factor|nr:rRNA maturation RNase YbeY [Spirochaetales bacterium]HQB54701.1 rRNA maturation RNase YbeY [Sphaerochaeta sp.]